MDKYIPTQIEPKWQKVWEKHKPYPAVDFDQKRPKKYLLVEFPYPSGEGLHIGHAFTNTILDVLARKKRMEGNNILYPMGWDAFGLPTENYAIKTGIHPEIATKQNTDRFRSQMKRLAFAYDWDREVNTTDPDYYRWTQWIFIQLFKHGLAYKAETPVGWCPACKIVLANEEIVAGKCERCGAGAERKQQKQWLLRITAYADRLIDDLDKVDYPDYVKAAQRNWIGRSEGAEIKFPLETTLRVRESREAGRTPPRVDKITVFTTRADTLFGVTAMVLAPEHPFVASLLNSKLKTQNSKLKEVRAYVQQARCKSELERTELAKEKTGVFTGFYCQNPINGERVPIWVGDYVVASYGGGAVMVVPAHDQRDLEFARKYNLPIKTVIKPLKLIKPFKPLKPSFAFEDDGILVDSGQFTNLTSVQARERITAWLTKKALGRKMISYHLRDWIFSRQHYWGEPIPMIFCPACAKKGITWWDTKEGSRFKVQGSRSESDEETSEVARSASCEVEELKKTLAGWFPLPESDLPLKLPKVKKYQPTDTGESPLANVKDWVKTTCPHCHGSARRETDTMPNWAGSSWYYLAYIMRGNSKFAFQQKTCSKQAIRNSKLFKYWLPVDLYLGGAEHTTLHLLYSRFWHKFLYDIGVVPGKEPYAVRRQHGVILGEDGARMSKSRGNVINPEDVVKEYGADTLRLYLLFMGPYEDTMPWNTKGVEGAYRFLNRIWRLVLSSTLEAVQASQGKTSDGLRRQSSEVGELASELQFSLHRLIKKVGEDIDSLKYNTAIAAMMEFVNEWSREAGSRSAERVSQAAGQPSSKSSKSPKSPKRPKSCALSREDIRKFLLLLAPFAPFMTEELWQRLCRTQRCVQRQSALQSIHQQKWPEYNPKFIKREKVVVVVQVNGKLRDRLEVTPEVARDEKKVVELSLALAKVQKHLPARPAGGPAGKAGLPPLPSKPSVPSKHPKFPKFIFVPGKLINFVVSR